MQSIGRRQVLMGAGAGTIAVAAIGLPASAAVADDEGHSRGLEGGWLITHTDSSPGAQVIQAVVTFAAGGAIASRDISPSGNAQLGSFRKTGDHNFVATFWDGFPAGPTGPDVTLKVIVKGSWNGDQISGTFTFTVFDATGAPVPGQAGDGTFKGTRIIAGT
jgi:hypothetical protein